MDSDDEVLSDLQSADELDLDEGTQDSDIDDIGGKQIPVTKTHKLANCAVEYEQEDGTFGSDKDYLNNPTKPYEVECKVLSPKDIQVQQDKQFQAVSNIIELPPEQTAILLRFVRWNKDKLLEDYVDNPEKLLEAAGLGSTFAEAPQTKAVKGFTCEICYEDEPGLQTYAMKCGHRYCASCYSHYLSQKVQEEGEAARIQCPRDGCHRIVDAKSLRLLVEPKVQDRYNVLLTRTYVDDKENLKWCPAPECEYAVECPVKKRDLHRVVPTVRCTHEHYFCFGCALADHQPSPCSLVKKWLKKCEDDSETSNWISANTKECPKCNSTIEKNGGCNHMTCRKCKHEFCWMCMGPWVEHGTSWYNCNRFEEKSGTDARDAQAKSRHSLERYLHYYNRYANHEQSAKLDKDLWLKTEKKMTSLQSQSNMSWIEVQFLDTASKALQACRQTLKWTYAFAFYLARNNMTEIFEDNQKDLEMAVENLSAMFEKPVNELAGLKVDILDKTTYCNRRREILLSDTAENLKKGEHNQMTCCCHPADSDHRTMEIHCRLVMLSDDLRS
jgi:ariadne-1